MDRKEKGRRALALLEDPVFEEAIDMARDSFIEEWRNGDTVKEREAAHAKDAALDDVLRQLRVLAQRGGENPDI